MLGKTCGILLILLVVLIDSAFAGYYFRPIATQNLNESDKMQINSSAFDNESIRAAMLKLPLCFIENRGQSSDEVKFMVKTSQASIYFTPSEVQFALSSKSNTTTVRMSFKGSKQGQLVGEGLLPGVANFFIGNNSPLWITEIPTYGSVRYTDIYPGVDLVFKGIEGNLKHELVLNPGANPDSIVLTYSGQDNLSIDKDGSILIRTVTGNLTDSAPVCYQDINGEIMTVEGRYRKIGEKRVGFEIRNYSLSYPLVIDPTLKYSTYLGGSHNDYSMGIAVDGSGNAYVTGITDSTDFPPQNPIQSMNKGQLDVFVTKLNPGGTGLVYSTYLGGSGKDYGKGIAVDGSGNAYVTGYTMSANFPTINPYQRVRAGGTYDRDAFVAKLNRFGSMVYSTYLGGSSTDEGNSIAVDASGNAYVVGVTSSTDFPIAKRYVFDLGTNTWRSFILNPYQGSNAGKIDVFIAKLNPGWSRFRDPIAGGSSLVYSTYLGGSGIDDSFGIAVDGNGNAYVTGTTDSTDFPTQNPIRGTFAGGYWDAFVTRLNPGGTGLVYSTYLGGSRYDDGYGIVVDISGNAYVTGITDSTDFPTQNPIQATNAGGCDTFVTKLNPGGTGLVYSTYLGGSNNDASMGIAVDGSGNAYVTGGTYSNDFPTQNPIQGARAGNADVFVTKLNPGGSGLVYSTYLGGSDTDEVDAIAVDGSGNAYVAGGTRSNYFPTQNPIQGTNAGGYDAFIAAVSNN